MAKVGIVVLADAETHGDMGRMSNALTAAGEFKEAGEEVTIIFDGAGTRWVPKLTDEDHMLHEPFEAVKDVVSGACHYCAGAFHVREDIEETDVPLLQEYSGHPSLQKLVSQGYQVITF